MRTWPLPYLLIVIAAGCGDSKKSSSTAEKGSGEKTLAAELTAGSGEAEPATEAKSNGPSEAACEQMLASGKFGSDRGAFMKACHAGVRPLCEYTFDHAVPPRSGDRGAAIETCVVSATAHQAKLAEAKQDLSDLEAEMAALKSKIRDDILGSWTIKGSPIVWTFNADGTYVVTGKVPSEQGFFELDDDLAIRMQPSHGTLMTFKVADTKPERLLLQNAANNGYQELLRGGDAAAKP